VTDGLNIARTNDFLHFHPLDSSFRPLGNPFALAILRGLGFFDPGELWPSLTALA